MDVLAAHFELYLALPNALLGLLPPLEFSDPANAAHGSSETTIINV